MSAPIVVYACVAGKYERELAAVEPTADVEYICFTDVPKSLRAPGWKLRPLESPRRLTSGHDINRFHKAFPHRLFPDADWSVYLDANLSFAGDIRDLIAPVANANAALGAFWHPRGHDLGQEVEACGDYLKFDSRDAERARIQLGHYADHGVMPETRIPMNGVLVRDHGAPGLDLAMAVWWAQMFEFAKRDQISLLYALKRTGLTWQPLDDEGLIDTARLKIGWHRPPLIQRIRRRLALRFGWMDKG